MNTIKKVSSTVFWTYIVLSATKGLFGMFKDSFDAMRNSHKK